MLTDLMSLNWREAGRNITGCGYLQIKGFVSVLKYAKFKLQQVSELKAISAKYQVEVLISEKADL